MTGVNVAPGLVLRDHRSRVDEVIAGSSALVVAVIETVAVTAGGLFVPSGPFRNGVTVQSPPGMSLADKSTFEVLAMLDARSGSPNAQFRSKIFGLGAATCAARSVVSDGTRYVGTTPFRFGNFRVEVVCGASLSLTSVPSLASTKYSSGTLPEFVTLMLAVTGVPDGSVVLGESGKPVADAVTGVTFILTVNGWVAAVPDTLP